MFLADQWKDYEVLDTSEGEKLERWGDYLLIRPDPQVIWNTQKGSEWKKVNGHYHRSSKGGGSWEFFDLPQEWMISYKDRNFMLKPFSFKHTGLFPEQAVNWDWFMPLIRERVSSGKAVKVLNLFAYTGLPLQAHRSPTSTPQRAWLPGQRKTHSSPILGMPLFAGLSMTAQNSLNARSGAVIPMMRLSWIRRPMAEGPKARSGRWRTTSMIF